jgi:hypothetical protein
MNCNRCTKMAVQVEDESGDVSEGLNDPTSQELNGRATKAPNGIVSETPNRRSQRERK